MKQDTRVGRAVATARADLTSAAATAARSDADHLVSPTRRSPTPGETTIVARLPAVRAAVEDAAAADQAEQGSGIVAIDEQLEHVRTGRAVHPPSLFLSLWNWRHRTAVDRFPAELLVIVALAVIEIDLLIEPLLTGFNLRTRWVPGLVATLLTGFVIVFSHSFAQAAVRAQKAIVPAGRDRALLAAWGLGGAVVLTGVVAIMARVKADALRTGVSFDATSFGLFVLVQVVFVVGNLLLPVKELQGRLDRWLAGLAERRRQLEADGDHVSTDRAVRAFWEVVFEALLHYRSVLAEQHRSMRWRLAWSDRTAMAVQDRGLLREVIPGAPLDPTPDGDGGGGDRGGAGTEAGTEAGTDADADAGAGSADPASGPATDPDDGPDWTDQGPDGGPDDVDDTDAGAAEPQLLVQDLFAAVIDETEEQR